MVHSLEFVLPIGYSSFTFIINNYPAKDAPQIRSFYRVKKDTTPQIYCVSKTTDQSDSMRRTANYQPSFWRLDFVDSIGDGYPVESHKETAKMLEDEVRCMLESKHKEPIELLELVDDIERLGLGYKLRDTIKRVFARIISQKETYEEVKKSLHASSLYFRHLRQNSFMVSTEIFDGFQDEKGNFKADLALDVQGLLSLYEASHLAIEGETVLDVAKSFATSHLKTISSETDKRIKKQVDRALELPFHRRMQRLEARWHIETSDGANEQLLYLAKLDYNYVQSELQTDLREVKSWWAAVDLAKRLSFARDRLVESFFWAVGMVYEPQYGKCTQAMTQVFKLVTILDDVYDVYGSPDELEQFTRAVDRWDINELANLPDYMKLCFLALYNTVNDLAYETLKDKGEVVIPYLARAWADLLKAFYQEACWNYKKEMPSLDEYLENALVSVSGGVFLVHAYFLVTQNITKEGIERLGHYQGLLRWPSIVFRLTNDMASSQAEIERGETANALTCYMHETGHSEQEAREHLNRLIDYSWKKMNEELLSDSSCFEASFKEIAINLARISHCQYQHGDAHSSPDERAKNRVLSVIFEPIPLTDGEKVVIDREKLLASL